jgi:predicted dehydrogenase
VIFVFCTRLEDAMKNEGMMHRRDFLLRSAAGGAVLTLTAPGLAAVPIPRLGRNEALRIGFVGVGGRGFGGHVRPLAEFAAQGVNIELPAVCDVYSENRDRAAAFIQETTGRAPTKYVDYREMYAREDLDAVCIGTPDHWHALQTLDAFEADLHVFCEKPMTKTLDEALQVMRRWNETGKVMQVGVQSTSLPVWTTINRLLRAGELGKVLMYQTEFFRNSNIGQWRHYQLTERMSPSTIDWSRWLGVEDGLTEAIPFDRAVFRQWRRFWPFGAGMYTDLFVHRTTSMLKATGLRFPARVVGSGGIYLEYDGRDVPDVATVVAEFDEGVQGLVTASMVTAATPITQLIRGHYGSFVLGNGENFTGFDFVPESERVTGEKLEGKRIEVEPQVENTTRAHFANWLEAIDAGDPHACDSPPDLGAAAIAVVNLGARSYREDKVLYFDRETLTVREGDGSWAKKWEEMSHNRASPRQIPGWEGGARGSTLEDPPHMRYAGPWTAGRPPEGQ